SIVIEEYSRPGSRQCRKEMEQFIVDTVFRDNQIGAAQVCAFAGVPPGTSAGMGNIGRDLGMQMTSRCNVNPHFPLAIREEADFAGELMADGISAASVRCKKCHAHDGDPSHSGMRPLIRRGLT